MESLQGCVTGYGMFWGIIIKHRYIIFRQAALFRIDGVHLLECGMDIWLHNICDGL